MGRNERRQPVALPHGSAAVIDPQDQSRAVSAARDSMTVAAWTIISRVTGVIRFAVIAAVLGPTLFGNTYQLTNSLPNLLYYGLLAGSLFSSLLVPALVKHIDAHDQHASERVAGGFLGITLLMMLVIAPLVMLLVIAPLAIILGPLVLGFAALGRGPQAGEAGAQMRVGLLLIVMFIPQIFFYGVVGTATAVMNARRRFALAAGAPAVESLGTIAVLGAAAFLYGTHTALTNVPTGEIVLLGLGSTGAVALHAATQWLAARRAGVVLKPRAGWRDPEVRVVIRRALPSIAQAGLASLQILTLLMLANRLPGGVIAFQIALNFYYLAIAIGVTPVALSLLPRLARMHLDGETTAFFDTLVRGLAMGLLVTIPAAVGYLVLAVPLARAISFGRMESGGGVAMIAVSLAALSLAVVGQTAFMILTYACYARKDTRTPLVSMLLQAIICLGLASTTLLVKGPAMLLILGLALSLSVSTAALHLTARVWPNLSLFRTPRFVPSLARFVAGAAIMAGPAWLAADAVPHWFRQSLGSRVGIAAGVLVGGAVFLALQALWRTPELGWLAGGLSQRHSKDNRALGEVSSG